MQHAACRDPSTESDAYRPMTAPVRQGDACSRQNKKRSYLPNNSLLRFLFSVSSFLARRSGRPSLSFMCSSISESETARAIWSSHVKQQQQRAAAASASSFACISSDDAPPCESLANLSLCLPARPASLRAWSLVSEIQRTTDPGRPACSGNL